MKERILILVVSYHTINFFRKIILDLLAKGHSVRILALHELPFGAKEDKFDTHRANWHLFEWDKIEEFNPTRLVVFNGYFRLIHASISYLRQMYRTLFVEIAWFPQSEYIYVDHDIHHKGEIAQSVFKAQNLDRDQMSEIIADKKPHLDSLRAKYATNGPFPEGLPEKFVLVPLQLERDTSIVYASEHFKDMNSLVGWVKRCAKPSNIPVVVKTHPKDDTDEREFMLRLDQADVVIKGKDFTMNSLASKASVIYGINSTSLMEAMIHYKPVLQLGYNIADKGANYISLKDSSYRALPQLFEAIHKGHDVVDRDRIDITLLTMLANQIPYQNPPQWVSDQIIEGHFKGRKAEDL